MPHWLLQLLNDYGYPSIFLAVFFNNIGMPIPGDTFLLGGGFFVEEDIFYFWKVVGLGTAACFLGGQMAYVIGRRYGRRYLTGLSWYQFDPEKLKKVDHFFNRYGPKMIFFGRFVALIHPITGLLAGMGKTPARPFLIYNLLGSAAYALSYTALGYFFGQSWDVLKMWMGRSVYLAAAIMAFILFALLFRRSVTGIWRRFSGKGQD